MGMVCCRAKAATYIGRGGFGFVGRPFRATWWGGVCRPKDRPTLVGVGMFFVGLKTDLHWQGWVCFCRAKAATYIGRVGFVFVELKPRLAFKAGSFKKGVEGSAKKEKWLPELDLNQ